MSPSSKKEADDILWVGGESASGRETGGDRESDGRRRKKGRSRAVSIIGFILAMLIALGVLALLYLQGTLNLIGRVNRQDLLSTSAETFDRDAEGEDTLAVDKVRFDTDSIRVMQDDDVKNILLIGQDKRHGETERQRSDTMIICSINTQTNKITLVSFMRDMYVEIPGYSANRMNSAYELGGMALLDEVIRTNFGVTIDGNVEVDFDGFLEALIRIGEIEMELTEDEALYLNANAGLGTNNDTNSSSVEEWDLQTGRNVLTPDQALAYARARYVGNSDYERTERQRKVIMAAFDKVKGSDLATVCALAAKILPYLTTDMGNQEILSYVKTVFVDHITTIESYRIPTNDGVSSETIDGMDVLLPDLLLESAYLQYYLYSVDSELLDETYKLNAWDTAANREVNEVASTS